ncbi:tyrosine-type recombinase/integrase [Halalkalibacter akibai]|uniref:Putative tyrosine recombinase n=1 Tax=Halalkalibacter akibai (strain ATCC 43226 / DSM 21942 / CIP 109018 / JCM 9157 / 1139) TaxID=1236973 RepID=W4QU52_HALA3|nr:tyrosine-type recombinase/integrase [Halalkalibacter akibai]GAE35700.1 putative tyrosine recombinase [Halalkalibacter akibai JCM 9157]
MCNFKLKIEEYNKTCKLAVSTKKEYVKALQLFCDFLSLKLKCSVEEVDLKRIYVVRIKSGDIYTPIRSTLLDEFLYESADKSYYRLKTLSCALKSFFRYLYRNENFPDVTSTMKFDIKKYKEKRKPIRILSKHEILKLFNSIVTHSEDLISEVLLFSLLFSTGMRISELLDIKINEIDFEREMLLLEKTKNRRERIVSLRNGFGEVLKYYCTTNDLSESDYLFGHKFSKDKLRSKLKKYLKKANLPYVRIHSIRHSFATHMLDAGSHIFIVQQLLGHEYLSSTRSYVAPNYTRNKNIVIKEHHIVYKKIEDKINAVLQI